MNLRKSMLAVAVAMLPVTAVATEMPNVHKPLKIRVRRGDTLTDLAARHLWPLFVLHNSDKITNPDLIYPGQIFTLPALAEMSGAGKAPFMAPKVRIDFAHPDDLIFSDANGNRMSIAEDQSIGQTGVATVNRGPVFAVMGNATIKVHGGSQLEFVGIKQDKEWLGNYVALPEGRLSIKSPHAAQQRLIIQTNLGSLDLREGTFDVRSQNGELYVSCFSGSGSLVSGKQDATIAAGQGLLVSDAGVDIGMLPAAPGSRSPSGVVSQNLNLKWEAVPGVKTYRVRIARDRAFTNIQFEGEIYKQTSFVTTLSEAGDYYWSVDAISEKGLVSVPLPPLKFAVSTLKD